MLPPTLPHNGAPTRKARVPAATARPRSMVASPSRAMISGISTTKADWPKPIDMTPSARRRTSFVSVVEMGGVMFRQVAADYFE